MNAKRLFYVLCGMLAILIVGGGFAYYMASKNLHASIAEVSKRQADADVAEERVAKLSDLEKQYQRLAPVINQMNTALPRDKAQSDLSLQLQTMANKSNMKITSLQFTPSAQPGPTSQTTKVGDVLAIPVTFQLKGTYNQLQTFLKQLEQLNRYTNITSLSITKADDSILYSVQLNAYLKP